MEKNTNEIDKMFGLTSVEDRLEKEHEAMLKKKDKFQAIEARWISQDSLDTEPLDFGKYNGEIPNDLLYDDPQYLVWVYEKTNRFPCSEELYKKAKEFTKKYPQDKPWQAKIEDLILLEERQLVWDPKNLIAYHLRTE